MISMMAAQATPTTFIFLSAFLLVSSSTMKGTKHRMVMIRPMLFHSQNLALFFSLAGLMRLAFFHSWEPMIRQIISSTRKATICHRVGMNLRSILPKVTSTASTSQPMASSHSTMAPMR